MALEDGRHPSRTFFALGAFGLVQAAYYVARTSLGMAIYRDFPRDEAPTWLFTVLALATVIGLPLGGLVADRLLGLKRTLLAGMGFVAAGSLACMARAPGMIFVAVALLAVGELLTRTNLLVYVGSSYTAESSWRASAFFALYGAVNAASLFAGFFSSALTVSFGGSYALVGSVLFALAALVLIVLAPAEEPPPVSAEPEREQSPLQNSPVLSPRALTLLFFGLAMALLAFVSSAQSHGVTSRWIAGGGGAGSLIWNVNSFIALALSVVGAVVFASHFAGDFKQLGAMVIAAAGVVLALSAVAISVISAGEPLGNGGMLMSQVLESVAELCAWPLAYTFATAIAEGRWRATTVGLWGLCFAGGHLAAPLMGAEALRERPMLVGLVVALGAAAFAVIIVALRERLQSAVETTSEANFAGNTGGTATLAGTGGGASSDATTDLIVGGISLALGIVVTVGSMALASGGRGGRYVITTGLIIFGLVRLLRGLKRLAGG